MPGLLKNHISESHEGNKEYSNCPICNKKLRKNIIAIHVREVHEGLKPYKCSLCDYRSGRSNTIKLHIASVHSDRKCSKCDEILPSREEMKKHVKTVHKSL